MIFFMLNFVYQLSEYNLKKICGALKKKLWTPRKTQNKNLDDRHGDDILNTT